MKVRHAVRIGILSAVVFLCACSAQTPLTDTTKPTTEKVATTAAAVSTIDSDSPSQESPNVIESGDFVTANYNLRLKSGELIVTSSKALANDSEEKKAAWFFDPQEYGPEQFIAGKESQAPQLAQVVIGMHAGEKKTIPLPPSSGFGDVNDQLIKQYPIRKTIPRVVEMSAQEFASRFNSFPHVGQSVPLTPYYTSKVTAVGDKTVTLEANVEDGKTVDSGFGPTQLTISDQNVLMTLSPKIGAPFAVMGKRGSIVSVGEENFTVDYNHPGAGKMLALEVEVVDFEKASDFNSKALAWIEDHDAGYEAAAEEHKPMVLVLYASWCGWSKRLLNETIMDPRIQDHWDDFVWVKVDSDQEKAYHELYEQNGYPMIVLVSPEGEIIQKLDGFKDARALLQELDKCLEVEHTTG
ncbi:thioredoxin family protein [uncultured Desulfosarcina sp.]|uniref:thioredoxin family protein n=1 Tax=uncultured Desulfosarcina sp. TaxID=218289 RepID=UPI0029C600FF|nr:thioredoxin family protein [uncultured Desulfosarcina sp.]